MKTILVSALALGALTSAALAEPVTLSDAQMNSVVAGQSAGVGIGQFGLVNAAVLAAVAGIGVQNN